MFLDVESTLNDVKKFVTQRKLGKARHALHMVSEVSYDRFVYGLADQAIIALRQGNTKDALNDTDTAKIVYERHSASVAQL